MINKILEAFNAEVCIAPKINSKTVEKRLIITHPGIFHGDDALCVALLRIAGYDCPVERRTPTGEELADTSVIVVDVGMQYDPDLMNFDHHQDRESPAACILVAKHLGLYEDFAGLLDFASEVDRKGPAVTGDREGTIPWTVRTLNGYPKGWELAVEYCRFQIERSVVDNMTTEAACLGIEIIARKHVEATRRDSQERWDREVTIDDKVAETTTVGRPYVGWQEWAPESVHFLLCPGRDGQTNLVSRDSEKYPVPEGKGETFRHAAGFLAVYPSRGTAHDAVGYSI